MWTSDAVYDKFMGRFSTRLAPVFADFAGVEAGQHARRRRRHWRADGGARAPRRGCRAAEPSSAFVAALRDRFPGVDVRQAGAEELPWPDDSFDVALAQLVVTFMSDAPAGIREMQRVAPATVAVCMWDRDAWRCSTAINRTRNALGVPTKA